MTPTPTRPGRKSTQHPHLLHEEVPLGVGASRIDAEITSVGIVVPAAYFRDAERVQARLLRRMLHELNPGLTARTEDVELVEDVHVIPNYSFQVQQVRRSRLPLRRRLPPVRRPDLLVRALRRPPGVRLRGRRCGWATSTAVGRGEAKPFHDYMVHAEKGIDVLEDMIDTFWENPLAFAFMVHNRYREPMIDMFSGRIYEGMPIKGRDEAMAAFRELLERERTYDDAGLFSVPIGSRFHEERAPLWNSELDSVETTERWLRDNA